MQGLYDDLFLYLDGCTNVAVEVGEGVGNSIDMINSTKCKVYVKKKAPIISVDKCEAPKLYLFNEVMIQNPRILSSMTQGFEIEAHKQNTDDSDWKSINVPYQLQTEINSDTQRSTTKPVSL